MWNFLIIFSGESRTLNISTSEQQKIAKYDKLIIIATWENKILFFQKINSSAEPP